MDIYEFLDHVEDEHAPDNAEFTDREIRNSMAFLNLLKGKYKLTQWEKIKAFFKRTQGE